MTMARIQPQLMERKLQEWIIIVNNNNTLVSVFCSDFAVTKSLFKLNNNKNIIIILLLTITINIPEIMNALQIIIMVGKRIQIDRE